MSNRQKQLKPLKYSDAGVDIDAGDALISDIAPHAKRTRRSGADSSLGGFGGLFDLKAAGFIDPVLVAATDGVGTKLELAKKTGLHRGIGIDLVAMCANDILAQGAMPLFFLDYFATGKLDRGTATEVISGIADGCLLADCALIGGETAEMPGMYEGDDYDMAGFCVGVVEKAKVIDGTKVKPGDQLIALGSSGPHSNGYSLIRKVIEVSGADVTADYEGKPLADHLMAPTKIYVKSILKLLETVDVHALSHITGGGFWENIPRVLPAETKAVIDGASWQWPAVFNWLQQNGNIETHEMYRTFNCGVGMVLAVSKEDVEASVKILKDAGENVWHIGEIAQASADEEQVEITGV